MRYINCFHKLNKPILIMRAENNDKRSYSKSYSFYKVWQYIHLKQRNNYVVLYVLYKIDFATIMSLKLCLHWNEIMIIYLLIMFYSDVKSVIRILCTHTLA